jgi:hypothetical protein
MAGVKKIKKAQSGVRESISMDKMGRTQLVSKTNTPEGPRYYKTIGPSESSARTRNMFNIRSNSADSVRAKDVDPIDMKKLSEMKKGGKIAKAKDGKWMQKVSKSIKKRGTEGKCTPITKPGCTGKAKALAKTFKKIAAKRKAK